MKKERIRILLIFLTLVVAVLLYIFVTSSRFFFLSHQRQFNQFVEDNGKELLSSYENKNYSLPIKYVNLSNTGTVYISKPDIYFFNDSRHDSIVYTQEAGHFDCGVPFPFRDEKLNDHWYICHILDSY